MAAARAVCKEVAPWSGNIYISFSTRDILISCHKGKVTKLVVLPVRTEIFRDEEIWQPTI